MRLHYILRNSQRKKLKHSMKSASYIEKLDWIPRRCDDSIAVCRKLVNRDFVSSSLPSKSSADVKVSSAVMSARFTSRPMVASLGVGVKPPATDNRTSRPSPSDFVPFTNYVTFSHESWMACKWKVFSLSTLSLSLADDFLFRVLWSRGLCVSHKAFRTHIRGGEKNNQMM